MAERRRLADAPGRDLCLADMDEAAEKGAGGQHDGAGAKLAPVREPDAGAAPVADEEVVGLAFDHVEIRLGRECGLHGAGIEPAVGLGARAAHGRALAPVEQAELDAGRVRHAPHEPVQRIDLAHEMPFPEPADGRVARHGADRPETVRDEGRRSAEPRRGGSRLAARMAPAHHDHVEVHVHSGGPCALAPDPSVSPGRPAAVRP